MSTNDPSFNKLQGCPASLIQLQFWVIHHLNPDSPAYNLPSVSIIEGNLDITALETAINALLRRHPIFRTTFDFDDSGRVVQRVISWQRTLLLQDDLRPSPGVAADASVVNQALLEEIQRTFDLASSLPMRFRLYRNGESSYLLVMTAHHIVFDLVTKDLFAEALGKEYQAALSGNETTDIKENTNYADYCVWQEQWMYSDQCKEMETAWRRYLDGMEPSLTWLAGQPPETGSRHPADHQPVPITLKNELFEKMHEFCRKEKTTPFLVMLTGWALTVSRYSGQKKLSVGVPFTNRRKEEFKNTMGCFVNSLPLTFDISDNPTLQEALHRVRKDLLQLHRIQEMPYYHLVQLMRRDGIIGGNTLYQTGFTFGHPMRLHLDGLRVEPKYIHPGGAQLDLFATFWQEPDFITGVIKYDDNRFDATTVELIREDFLNTLNDICEHPDHHMEDVTRIQSTASLHGTPDVAEIDTVIPVKTIVDKETPKEAPVVSIAASFSGEFIQEFMEFWFLKLGWNFEVKFAPFNQVFQELLNASSLLRSNRKGHNILMIRLEDLIDKDKASSWNEDEANVRWTRLLDELREAIATGAKNMTVPLCFVLCPPSPRGREIQRHADISMNLFLEALRSTPGVTVLTHEEIDRRYPVTDYYDPLGENIGAIPFTRQYLAALATAIVRSLNTLSMKPVKALVLDCDGTLWQGVVGEDGPTGVIIERWQRAFQEFILQQYQSGVILCLCSKNQEDDPWSVFDRHPGMLLKREHISFWKINWEAKSDNLRALVKEMNIGMDAVAFLDDNPLERAEVGLRFPAIFCPEIPEAWEERTKWLEHCWLLDHPQSTAEDKKRQEHYRSEQIRDSLKQSAGSLAEFLNKLELKIDLNSAESADYERLAQLSIRTNQFNTTTLRLTVQEVMEYATAPGMSAHIARVRDRFGDYGLVGAMLARVVENTYRVDGMFLSCRALGRSVEYRMASYLAAKAKEAGCAEIEFPVKTTDRNEPARNFLNSLNKLCGGTRDKENSLHINTDQLVEFRYEIIREPEEATESSVGQESLETSGDSFLPNREPFIIIARKLYSVDTILNAVEQETREKQSRSTFTMEKTTTVVPETQTEQIIADVWKKILGLAQVNTQAKFFEVGGTSLLMVRVAIELKRSHDMDVSMTDLFKYPTIAGLAAHLDGKETTEEIQKQESATASAVRQREALSEQHLPDVFKRMKNIRESRN